MITKQGVRLLLQRAAKPRQLPIILRVTQIQEISAVPGVASYRLLLSDGERFVEGMLSSTLGSLVSQDKLSVNGLISVHEYRTSKIQNKMVVMISRATSLGVGEEDQVIGSPVNVNENPYPGAQTSTHNDAPRAAMSLALQPLEDLTSSPAVDLTSPPVSSQESSASGLTQLTQDTQDDSAEELFLLAKTEFNIVGIKYYDGVVHMGEFVQLAREPENPYDDNAVRVDNMRGIKVGHNKRQQAAFLAPIMNGQPNIKVEGMVRGRGDRWGYPVTVEFYGVSSNAETSESLMEQLTETLRASFQRKLRGHPVSWFRTKVSQAISVPVVVERKSLSWEQEQQGLDAMFEKQTREQLSSVPEIPVHCQFQNTELFSFQKQGISWLVHQETSGKPPPFFKQVMERKRKVWLCEITQCSQPEQPPSIRGSILADEMGLGKTLQTLGLILAAPPANHTYPTGDLVEMQTPKSVAAASTGKLPTKSELKMKKVDELRKVLTSAGISASGKKADLEERIVGHIKKGTILEEHFDESRIIPIPGATPLVAGSLAPFCTLIVAPVSVLSNWVQQVQNHVKEGVLRVVVYQGTDRQSLIPSIKNREIDILLVSYHTLAADYSNCFGRDDKKECPPEKKKRKMETLFDIPFHRIVLDEAHAVRSSKTRFFKAVKKIQAERKLGLTGTPFVNRPDDIHSLFSFLELTPLADQAMFRRSITLPIQAGEEIGLARLRAALAHVALRRSKAVANINLVNKQVQLCAISFPNGPDKDLYDALYKTFRKAATAVMSGGEAFVLEQYSGVLEILLRMRQACCSVVLVPEIRRDAALKTWNELKKRDMSAPLTPEEGQKLMDKLTSALCSDTKEIPECSVCLEELEENAVVVLRSCSHVFCENCISRVATTSHKCPLCRKHFQKSDLVKKSEVVAALSQNEDEHVKSISFGENGPSPKIIALLQAMKEMKPDEKGVIFSQFTSFLDIVAKVFENEGIGFQRVDGRMNTEKRSQAINAFMGHSGPRFILCSLHAAGTGINLTRGNVVFMLDCWWNQSVENQAMDRVHRIGQKRDVRVVRFVMKDSIEERMVQMQESKNAQAKGAFAKLSDKEKRLSRLQDLRRLLEISEEKKEM